MLLKYCNNFSRHFLVLSFSALVRAWWNDHCGPAQRAVVRDYMQKNLSTFIIKAEIWEINQGAKDGLWDTSEVSIKVLIS